MDIAVPELEFDLRVLLVEMEAPTIGKDPKGPVCLTLVQDHHAREHTVSIAILDEDDATADRAELAWLQDCSPCRGGLEELNEFAA